jgi:hypothetical protein
MVMIDRLERRDPPSSAAPWETFRSLAHRFRKYWPEASGFAVMMVYTAVRTALVAKGIDTVARTDRRIFLLIEVVTTVPYVWGIGDLVRGAMLGTYKFSRTLLGFAAVLAGVILPYAYIGMFGGFHHRRSALITIAMILVACIGLRQGLARLARTRRERHAREAALAAKESAFGVG